MGNTFASPPTPDEIAARWQRDREAPVLAIEHLRYIKYLRGRCVIHRTEDNEQELIKSLDELANLLAALNEPEDRGPCLAAFQELLALRAKSLGPGHPDTQKTQIELATAVAQFDRCGFNNTAGGDE